MLKWFFGVALFATMSCNPVETDAKKAASLINKSIEQTYKLELDKAEKTYLKAQEIIKKYAEQDTEEEFYELLAEYRDKEKKQNAK